MSDPSSGVVLRTYSADEAQTVLQDILVPVWEAIYGDIAVHDPFFTTERFVGRFDGYAAAPGFALCTASLGTRTVIGLAFGYTLQRGARWWNGLQAAVPGSFTAEDGHRTFAINEIMVLESERRRGVATALHRHLLTGRSEARATLLVEPDNTPARSAYIAWGWKSIGVLKPFPDSPTYESMIRTLPL